ncbi:acetoacetate--CoA ligase [Nocardioides immobilis]|uniref:Acetoacetate--CoA ligase n=1 Tax=Nocardioides immobilis TaxID=2049295 RepID=A0A417Y134_9ACTN|nr:acetoacetate--CoA ligase [Nocardioides immobilis]RHW26274.1 acetoacetate--CoA ligase [Nocardioides immobilis]
MNSPLTESPLEDAGAQTDAQADPRHRDDGAARLVWSPDPRDAAGSQVGRFLEWLRREREQAVEGYEELWRWSVEEPEEFWAAVWAYFEVEASVPYERVLTDRDMPGARWFTGARLNYAAHVLRTGADDAVAVVALDEDGAPEEMTWGALRGQVGAFAAALRELGVRPGDRVAGYLPNIPAAVVAMLATTGIGAVWTAVSPDFGTRSVLDRLGQVEPTVLVAVDGYRFNGRHHDRTDTVAELVESLPSVRRTILVRSQQDQPLPSLVHTLLYEDLVAVPRALEPVHVDADHPLWILFSSGTTGKPKGIVQSHAGILLEHLKSLGLCLDLGPGDRYFFHSSTSWMAWNFLVGGLLHGATIVLYSGSPSHDGVDRLWRRAAEVRATVLGMGAAYANACAKAGVRLGDLDLHCLRTVIPTGAPLPLGGWQWLVDELPARARIDAICGGTDVCTVFFGGSPLLPVRFGRISGRWLGVDAHAYDESGQEVVGGVGEFVVTTPMPSMPVEFWNDPDGARLRAVYFSAYPGIWSQGDWIVIDTDGTVQVLGRSDATLNRGGVRLGSADIYTLVEGQAEVADSLVVGVELPDGEYYMPMFIVPSEGAVIDDGLRERLSSTIRAELSPRHVPDAIIEVPGLPRTLTGKKLEIPVKRILQGRSAAETVSTGSIDHPELLAWFERFALDRARAG